MSYEPTLVINKSDLDKAVPILEKESFETDIDEEEDSVIQFLLRISKYDPIIFGDLELVLCNPELTSFNKAVRDKLYELDIDYREVI